MANVSGGDLAGAVSGAGGLGFIGVGHSTDVRWIAEQSALARDHGRFGIGLMAWAIELRPELLEATLAAGPAAVAVSFGDPAAHVPAIREAGALAFAQVHDGASAYRAVAAGVDALVAQGSEAGGHSGAGVATLPLLQVVLEIGDAAGLPVLAAGGIATGRAVAGVLAMGAAGAWIGTRFAATREALGRPAAKQRMIDADETDTVLTSVFDIAQDIPWPPQFPGRALRNAFAERWHGREHELRAQRQAAQAGLEEARTAEDFSEMYVYAGQASGLVLDVPPAAELVARLASDAERHGRGDQGGRQPETAAPAPVHSDLEPGEVEAEVGGHGDAEDDQGEGGERRAHQAT